MKEQGLLETFYLVDWLDVWRLLEPLCSVLPLLDTLGDLHVGVFHDELENLVCEKALPMLFWGHSRLRLRREPPISCQDVIWRLTGGWWWFVCPGDGLSPGIPLLVSGNIDPDVEFRFITDGRQQVVLVFVQGIIKSFHQSVPSPVTSDEVMTTLRSYSLQRITSRTSFITARITVPVICKKM